MPFRAGAYEDGTYLKPYTRFEVLGSNYKSKHHHRQRHIELSIGHPEPSSSTWEIFPWLNTEKQTAWEKSCGSNFRLTSRTIVQPCGGTREVPCRQLTKKENKGECTRAQFALLFSIAV